MNFDIHQLGEIDLDGEEGEQALYEYQDALIDLFYESPEGVEHRKTYPEMGYWAAWLIEYGYWYAGATIPQMTVSDVEEIVSEIFPRKISLPSPDKAKSALPELIAFWEYLKREYKLQGADAILMYLKGIAPDDFVDSMNDPSKFGMAKAFVMAGQSMGFDMTNEEEMNAFMNIYNATLMAQSAGMPADSFKLPGPKKQVKAKDKKKRKAVKAARKPSRRKKRK